MDRLIRLSFIIEYLTSNKKTTAKILATKLCVSKKTIYRDIEILSAMEIPIYVQPGRNGGIYILESYVISKTLVNDKEQISILSALKTLETTGVTSNDALSNKLSSIFQKKNLPSYKIDFSGWGKDTEKEKLDLIAESQTTEKILEFGYVDAQGMTSQRNVIVTSLNFKKNAWYFNAYCLNRNEMRLFKINRSHNLRLGSIYDSHLFNIASDKKENKMETVRITMKVKMSVMSRIQEDISILNLENIDATHVLIETSQPTGTWLIHYLLSFGSSLEILSPTSIRDKVIEEINLMKKNY